VADANQALEVDQTESARPKRRMPISFTFTKVLQNAHCSWSKNLATCVNEV